eukprot:TRINITY_DN1051_c3_g1_i1.p1 TRINITY_DN1051_c3_g1~~TRINITY_DN1051_c3_g1_i1.p1  ORF type:complete len:178 (+),score=16.87 TRINITY_DN1051_c3_g1_i1:78-611(+)
MPNTYITPWSAPTTNHSWYVAPSDDSKDYQLTRKYRQMVIDRQLVWGTRYAPTWSYWGPPITMGAITSYFMVIRGMMPWWLSFHYFGGTVLAINFMLRWHREFYFEYQLHKILTWGQFELSYSKRRMLGEKDKAMQLPDRKTKEDFDVNWFDRYREIRNAVSDTNQGAIERAPLYFA